MGQHRPDSGGSSPSATFISGAEHAGRIGHYINCAAAPYDLRPAADIIRGAAREMRETMPDDRPLVILMSEVHAMPAHVELQHKVAADLLAQEQPFTVNIEWAHNYWSLLAQEHMDKTIPSGLYYRPNDYDPEGQAALSSFLGFDGLAGAPLAHYDFMAFCHAEKIPALFNDAARRGGIDPDDPLTIAKAQEHLGRENAGPER